MPKKRKYERKPHHLTRPRILSFIAYVLILFFGSMIIANINPDANQEYREDRAKKNGLMIQWVFVDESGNKYDLDKTNAIGEHGSAEDFDYLLSTWSVGWSGQKEQKCLQNACESSKSDSDLDETWPKRYKKGYDLLWWAIEDRSLFINAVYTYLVTGKLDALPDGAMRYVVAMYGLSDEDKDQLLEYQWCMSPWGYEMEHGASVLAYQQRADTPNICNIQRRSCWNGKLSGSFTQRSCDESLGKVEKSSFVTKNLPFDQTELQGNVAAQEVRRNKLRAEWFIQPSKTAANADAHFNLLGHVGKNPDPTTVGVPSTPKVNEEPWVQPTPQSKTSCLTPWWEKVKAGQFVKAYRFKNGFTDIPCQVQIRICADGDLEGSYQHASCKPWNTSYEDFKHGYLNGDEPSPQRLLKMLDTDYTPDPEYWNTLDPVTADQMATTLQSIK